MDSNNNDLTFGFDIGIASVGWAVLAPDHIVGMGVRCFDAAEDKDGKPNNQTRRDARISRNRYRMRSWRLKRLVRLFRDTGMLTNDEIKQLTSSQHPKQHTINSPWELRSRGLSERLSPYEWAQVIYHLVKHRGFKFFSKTEDPTADNPDIDASLKESALKTQAEKELGALKGGLEFTSGLRKKYPQFTTLGNIAWQLANAKQDKDGIYRGPKGEALDTKDCEDFQESFRNKGKSYRHAFHRDDLRDELAALFDAQKIASNRFTDLPMPADSKLLSKAQIGSQERDVEASFRDQVFALLELQHPPIYTAQMDALIGKCELEKNELRAPKHCFSNERRTWLETLNHLRIKPGGGKERELSDAERKTLIDLPYTLSKVTFKQAREALRTQTGFPAHWREASFTKVSYTSKRKNDGSWINVVSADGSRTPLGKYGDDKIRKEANKKIKERLEAGSMSYAELRTLYRVKEGATFEQQKKNEQIILPALENQYPVEFGALDSKQAFINILPAKSNKSTTLARFSKKAMGALATLRTEKSAATLADLRLAMERAEPLESGWQFELSEKTAIPIRPDQEKDTQIPIEYEDAQQAEEETLIEMKGWHALKRALENHHPALWIEMQTAWREANSANETDKAEAVSASNKLDAIAAVLTKAQTDADIRTGLTELGLATEHIDSLFPAKKTFKDYRNLSLTAIRKILPFLEQQKSYSEACSLAGYKPQTHQRTQHLPPLETYLYERIRHGNKTGHTERRYKELNNPVVARAFNQARRVLNALIDKHGSPAYVHVELARDISKPLKGHWSNGKYIEGRLDIDKRQKENRNKRVAIRSNFVENHQISAPTERQMLKERLYHEQLCKCAYSLEKLDLDRVVREENYAQIDHIWPRSLTFDNSLDNLVLVHAHANQDKEDDIPYDFIKRKYGEAHWRVVQAHLLSCKGMTDGKLKRLLATELDADEFLARNLVDTRYSTRLFASMVRDRLLFEGQTEDKTDDIDPSESGKKRLDKFHKTRVRTPQGGVTAFLRRAWLGDIKDRDASDKHHAIDACIVAACTPSLIKKVNDWFAHQERVPNQFSKNPDGTYTDRCTGETKISKQEARERGLFLAPPWNGFRRDFLPRYDSLWVSRAARKKRNNELHDANPIAWQSEHLLSRIPLTVLTPDMLNRDKLPAKIRDTEYVAKFFEHNTALLGALNTRLEQHNGDQKSAFESPFYPPGTDRADQKQKPMKAIRLPWITPKAQDEAIRISHDGTEQRHKITEASGYKTVVLTALKPDMLTERSLGEQYYRRNKLLIDALAARLQDYAGDAEKAFQLNFHKPINPNAKRKGSIPELGPVVRSIRIPKNKTSGLKVRGGVAEIGNAIYTEVYWTGERYFFLPHYAVPDEQTFGIEFPPDKSSKLFGLTQDDMVEAILGDGTCHFGYFVMYESDGRLQIRNHDQQKKNAYRFGIAKLKSLRKFRVDVLGNYTACEDSGGHGVA